MLFNSFEFILVFLPVALVGFFVLAGSENPRAALSWLVFASLFFYGWWNPKYLALIIPLTVFNFLIGQALLAKPYKPLLAFGIGINLLTIGFYKYAGFLAYNIEELTGIETGVGYMVLPLGISFFIFQKIAYLVDAYRGEVRSRGFTSFALFVTFFPQLIAGPIVHHKEIIPQLERRSTYRINFDNIAFGLTVFSIGLFKKVVIADSLATFATPVFAAADAGDTIHFFEAWIGALAYTFQLYFDFSGYSDMAIGLARMFGIRLPENFLSPYKATSIIDFWRRWHVTLSRFLREYLYIPLGGNRRGPARRHINLMITMLLGGLWHGAGWNFVVWGGLHGFYLIVNHIWRHLAQRAGLQIGAFGRVGALAGWCTTFLVVVFAWLFFRATTLDGALELLRAMLGMNGLSLPQSLQEHLPAAAAQGLAVVFDFHEWGVLPLTLYVWAFAWVAACLVIVLALPTTTEFVDHLNYDRARSVASDGNLLRWQPSPAYASFVAILAFASVVVLWTGRSSEFLYFQF